MTIDTHGTREDYSTRIKQQLDEFNAQIDVLEEKMKEAKTEAQASYRVELAKLRLQSVKAAGTLDQLYKEGGDNWDQLVSEMDKYRKAFLHAVEDFKSRV